MPTTTTSGPTRSRSRIIGRDGTVQLLNRHWRITDSQGRLQEVRGPGVVGEQPTLRPGASRSSIRAERRSLHPSGIMVGSYEMRTENGELIEVAIPAFSLDSPYQPVNPN